MATFRKQEDCPTSEELLSYQLGDLPSAESRIIGRHLSACEFCSAEVDFYEHYPQAEDSEEVVESAKMPGPLFELAESILNHQHGSQSIAKIMEELDGVSDEGRRKLG
jgi:hypothetical protein